ncbi:MULTISPECIES: cell division protein FtsQ/DivIB [unclassified Neptuniibacter]|uniref:cell division protein FtsQ/DivIB n=1 Tax=unclassified Neptuniibacter TaxID=2630693 RepID=UPI0025D5BFA5|nr:MULTISPECIES: cell division protein FtsQ/DivIB [unclassified Neptuniibacter]|tara:strand:+ start:38180 stop:39052 length:873 start_codon:yes stop_codon:yes gene_type:complete
MMSVFRFFRSRNETVESEELEAEVTPRGASRDPIVDAPQQSEVREKGEPDWWWKPFWTLSSLMMFVGIMSMAGSSLWQWLDRPVENVVVHGTVQHLDRLSLAEDIGAGLTAGTLGTDLKTIRELVSEHPWVRVAAIERDWPNTLIVMVEEEVPVARWGERGLLNHEGDIFWPELKEVYRSLPRLSGPAPETERVMSQFHDLNQILRSIDLNVVSLNLEARGAWTLELDNHIKVVVGREAVNERLGRFLDLYRLRLSEQADEIEEIDIRYTHGVAVKWREKPSDEKDAAAG